MHADSLKGNGNKTIERAMLPREATKLIRGATGGYSRSPGLNCKGEYLISESST